MSKETRKRNCEKCKHWKKIILTEINEDAPDAPAKSTLVHGCEVWDCEFDPKEERE